jgi:hypothetical protein
MWQHAELRYVAFENGNEALADRKDFIDQYSACLALLNRSLKILKQLPASHDLEYSHYFSR